MSTAGAWGRGGERMRLFRFAAAAHGMSGRPCLQDGLVRHAHLRRQVLDCGRLDQACAPFAVTNPHVVQNLDDSFVRSFTRLSSLMSCRHLVLSRNTLQECLQVRNVAEGRGAHWRARYAKQPLLTKKQRNQQPPHALADPQVCIRACGAATRIALSQLPKRRSRGCGRLNVSGRFGRRNARSV